MPGCPGSGEYAEYYGLYVSQVEGDDVLQILEQQIDDTRNLLSGLPEATQRHRYAPGKWSLREVLGHLIDTERVFALRGLVFARGDETPLPSFEQNDYAASSNADDRTMESLLDEFSLVRAANLAMFRGFAPEAWDRRGMASGCEFTARSIPWILAGHEIHHRKIIEEKYLGAGQR